MLKILLLAALTTYAYGHEGDSAAQTDWSGGPGVNGPVTDWGGTFNSETGVIWSETPGDIHLGVIILDTPVEFTVDGNFDGARSVYAEDVDGDGDMDMLGAASWDDDITWWSNDDGTGTSWTEHTVEEDFTPPHSIYAEDVDGDGDKDILVAAPFAGTITWWSNDDGAGTSWTAHAVGGGYDELNSVYAEDVDGDGDTDVMATATTFYGIPWWSNDDGSGTSWTLHILSWRYNTASSVYAEDVDGDGDTDILATSTDCDAIVWWSNDDGSGTSWTERSIDAGFEGANSVYAADVDGDDDIDVLGAALNADEIAWWENVDGSGTSWTEHGINGDFDYAASVYAADIDGDGDADVLGAAAHADDITCWSNDDGSGTSWTEHTVDGDFDGASSVYAEDVDGDGYMDVIGAAVNADDITWWKAVEFLPSGELVSSTYDTEGSPAWGQIDWTDNTPDGTTVKFQLKASNYWTSMGTWSSEITTHPFALEGFIEDGLRYIKYRAILETTDTDATPTLEDVTIDWGYTDIAVTSFAAESAANGIEVSWECADEVSGFNLYRSAAAEGKAVNSSDKLNVGLITGESPYVYLDAAVEEGKTYSYWLEVVDVGGATETFGPVECTWKGALPTTYALYQSRPNPASGTAIIAFDLPEDADVTLAVYDISGRKVTTVVNETLPTGEHEAEVSGLAAGVYVYKLDAGNFNAARKMVVVE
jgi:hypothetical protein